MNDGSTDLYRFFDADGQLLYVGISFNAAQRAMQHRHDKGWWPEVARIEIQRLLVDRREAEAIERAAIVAEEPLYNVVHNRACVRTPPPVRFSFEVVEFDAAELYVYKSNAYDTLAEAIDGLAHVYDRLSDEDSDVGDRSHFLSVINGLARSVVYGDCCKDCDQIRYPIVVKFDGVQARCSYFCRRCDNHWFCWWTRDLSILGAC